MVPVCPRNDEALLLQPSPNDQAGPPAPPGSLLPPRPSPNPRMNSFWPEAGPQTDGCHRAHLRETSSYAILAT
jgi:hypothetical protein